VKKKERIDVPRIMAMTRETKMEFQMPEAPRIDPPDMKKEEQKQSIPEYVFKSGRRRGR
jgi:hypothetical protein